MASPNAAPRWLVADMELRAKVAGVPLVIAHAPDRVRAAMISSGEWPAGYDPYNLDRELRSIVESHGGTYIDILPGFRTVPNAEQYYFPVDGHPDSQGHAIISELLARELTKGIAPALKAVSPAQQVPAKGKKQWIQPHFNSSPSA